jgi:phospholipid N-methyltransferase
VSWKHTGAVAPSSRRLARAIVRPFATRPRDAATRGPGTGAFTREIARHLGPEDHLDVYDINPEFLAYIERRLGDDPAFVEARSRIHLHELDARRLPAEGRYAFLVSGLPHNHFPPGMVREFLDAYLATVAPGGGISFFEYLGVRGARRLARLGGEDARGVDRLLRSVFREIQEREEIVLGNVPPAIVHHLRRPRAVAGPEPRATGVV